MYTTATDVQPQPLAPRTQPSGQASVPTRDRGGQPKRHRQGQQPRTPIRRWMC